MPKTKMSYKTADKIISIYAELLMNLKKLSKYEKYAYSDLKGYDLIDISNAFKLTAAYRVFNAYDLTNRKVDEFKKYAEEDGSGLMQFFFHFYPDNVANELKKLDPNDKMAMLSSIKLTSDSQDELRSHFNKEETPDSFLDYCISIGRSDPNYWGKVYKRIGITWETNDDKDPIYVLIRHNVNYQSKEVTEPNYEIITPKEKPKNIFTLLKEKFLK